MRRPRERSDSGVYHVVLRGINRQDIFYDNDDYKHFLETIEQMKTNDQIERLMSGEPIGVRYYV
jgi:putative transposase